MKTETIGILFVCLILIVGGMVWIATAPADGEDEWTYLDPITEDASQIIVINHTGNATVIPVWIRAEPPYNSIHTAFFKSVRNNSDLLDNFERVYLMAYNWDSYKRDKDPDMRTIKYTMSHETRFFLVASEGTIEIHSWVKQVRMENIPVGGGYFRWDVETNADQTTYTFHYPKIIGWEDP
ncbi:MAG: hypothetical protein ACXADO_00550 [Candidatus Thorarchaeota archaeon]